MAENNALIGYTGFVGGNLAEQREYAHQFNSKNFREMAGQSYDQVVCAGVSAVKWKANKEPEKDWKSIQALIDVLRQVEAESFVLVSTIDVYPRMNGLDESFDCHSEPNHAYGKHRLAFEDFCMERFSKCHVIRLPALFGPGLKKNIIFDLLNDNCLEMINPASSFQYYNLENLSSDIERAVAAKLDLVNFFTAPVASADILERFFPTKSVGTEKVPEAHYDLRTRHADLRGLDGDYLYDHEEVMADLAAYIEKAKGGVS